MKSYILKYRLKPETNKVYEINSKTMYRNLLMEVKNSFQYDIDFIYEKEGAFNSYIVKNIKKNFKNLSEKESLLEKVFLEMDEPFSEIVYRISENGEIKQIENIDILRNKWFNKKIEIIKKYEEHKKEVEHYIQGIDQSLNNPKLVYDYFQNFGVNNVFFSGLYGKIYLIDMKKKSKISIPNFLNFFPLPLNLEIIPKKIDPVSDRFFLEIIGSIDTIKLDRDGIKKMFEINLSKEKIGELEYHVNYSQELSFCMSNGMVETSELKIKAQIFNKENEKELLYNELEINLFKKKEENE